MGLTHKQQAFIDNYSGNATEAAKRSGYSEATAYSAGQRLLKRPEIAEAIRKREQERQAYNIATRERRFEFWTQIMENPDEQTRDRLKASELLAKAEGDFIDRVNLNQEQTGQREIIVKWQD